MNCSTVDFSHSALQAKNILTEICRTAHNLTSAGRTVASSGYHAGGRFILHKCEGRNIISQTQVSDTLWEQVRTRRLDTLLSKTSKPNSTPSGMANIGLSTLRLMPLSISKKITLRPGASCSPCVLDAPGTYNVNSSS